MKKLLIPGLVAVLLSTAVPVAAQTDIPAALDQQIALINSVGGKFEFSAREVADGAVTFRDVVFEGGDGEVRLTAEWIRAEPSIALPGDVMLTLPPTMRFVGGANTPMAYEVEIASQNLAISGNWIAALTPSPRTVLTADSLQVRGLTDGHPIVQNLDVSNTGLSFRFDFNLAEQRLTGALGAEEITAKYAIKPDGTDANYQDADVSVTGLKGDVTVNKINPAGFPAFVDGGGSADFAFSTASSSGSGTMNSPEVNVSYSGTGSASTTVGQLLDGVVTMRSEMGQLTYDDVTIQAPGMPVPPFSASLESAVFALAGPLTQTEGPAPANITYEFNGLTVSDGLWGMIDPQGKIPRDPATLQINLDAMLQLKETLTALVARPAPPSMPTEVANIDSLTVNTVLLDIAGASVSANGALTFDNSGPFPMPNGALDVAINGVQGLANTLAELGLVPQQQVAGMMGMMMMVAQPTDQPDSFSSKIEVQNGQVTANGMPLPF